MLAEPVLQLQLAVREDQPELVALFDKALHALPEHELADLRAPYVGPLPPQFGFDRQQVLRWAGGAAAVTLLAALLMLAWNRRLGGEVRRRRAAEAALETAIARAEAASLNKSEFVARTSHELRTPLNALIGGSHLLRQTRLDTAQQRLLGRMHQASQSLLLLVDDLLDLARIESGHLALRTQAMALPGLLDDALAMVEVQASAKGLALRLEAAPDLPGWIQCDRRRLLQVLVNLLGNAVKYTASGSVTLRARAVAAGRLRFEVEDTGPGIDAALQQRMFEPFVQGKQADGPGGAGGVGLGLGIARDLVLALGGTLGLDSEPGRGSRFGFEIPAAAVAPPAERASAPAADEPDRTAAASPAVNRDDGAAGAGKLLLVEDNEVNQLVTQALLEHDGWQVVVAGSGSEAFDCLRLHPDIDLVLTDLGLPDIDGLEVARGIRALHGPQARLPIVGLTARVQQQEHDACRAAGMDDMLLKPVAPLQLYATLRRLLQPRRAGRRLSALKTAKPR